MKSLNKVYLLGRVGHAPELKQTKNQQPYVRLSLATDRRWKDETGEWKEQTDWHPVMIWGRQAEKCASQLAKGAVVFIEGNLSPYSLTNEDGSKTSRLSIHAKKVTFFSPTPLEAAAVAG